MGTEGCRQRCTIGFAPRYDAMKQDGSRSSGEKELMILVVGQWNSGQLVLSEHLLGL